MNLEGISRRTLENFTFFMSFFEYSKYLKDKNIISRKLKAPAYEDISSIKKRLSSVMLKGLRSEEFYNIGETHSSGDDTIIINNISRLRNSDDRIQRYMMFIVDANFSYAKEDHIPRDENDNFAFKVASPSDTATFFEYFVATSDDEFENCLRNSLIDYLNRNYSIGVTPSRPNGESFGRLMGRRLGNNMRMSTLSSGRHEDNSFGIHLRSYTASHIQEYFYSVGTYGSNAYGPIDYSRFIDITLNSGQYRDSFIREHNTSVQYYPISRAGLKGLKRFFKEEDVIAGLPQDEIWDKLMGGNINLHLMRSGNIILCKKDMATEGSIRIVPNLFNYNMKLELSFHKDILMNPDNFFDVNKYAIEGIKNLVNDGDT